ncbi:glycosyltransferase family 4 protein [Acinetobacter sp. c1-l78]|uniref:glycosyltransferase family 4 protein n=1 Tax=Acinetobacter sp. c1-l78 TaxID=3342803 RepID=UPI0035B91E8B
MKILHVNNIADVGNTLVHIQKRHGIDASLISVMPPALGNSLLKKIMTIPLRLKLAWQARQKIKQIKPDWVHIHYITSAIWFLGCGAKLALHAHGTDIRHAKNSLIKRILLKLVIARADLLLYATPDLQSHVEYFSSQAEYLPNPIDTNNYYSDVAKPNLPQLKVLWLAMPSAIKGIDTVLPAIDQLSQRYPSVRFSVLKNAQSVQYYQQHTQSAQIQLIEPVAQHQVKGLIEAHDVIIGQTFLGALGMSELQAMSCQRIVLCNNLYGANFAYAAEFFNCATTEQLCNNFSAFLTRSEPELQQRAQAARQWVATHHSHDAVHQILYKAITNFG